jgi:hypothetical protein
MYKNPLGQFVSSFIQHVLLANPSFMEFLVQLENVSLYTDGDFELEDYQVRRLLQFRTVKVLLRECSGVIIKPFSRRSWPAGKRVERRATIFIHSQKQQLSKVHTLPLSKGLHSKDRDFRAVRNECSAQKSIDEWYCKFR